MGDNDALRADPVGTGGVSGGGAVRDVSGQETPRHPDPHLLRPRAAATARVVITAVALDGAPAAGGAPCRQVS